MAQLRIGLIGSGFAGRSHALAFRAASSVFELPLRPDLTCLADIDEAAARSAARALGVPRWTGEWRKLVEDPEVDLVAVAAPTGLHEAMALAAIAAGKDVYCEKPLAPDAATARRMADAAATAGAGTMVGFNYLKNPITRLAREIIASGEIGEPIGFRGIHAEDYFADPAAPFAWRHDPAHGPGAVADLGSHIISLARCLLGPVAEVHGQLETVVARRPLVAGGEETRDVEVDDQARALLRFESGAGGTLEASWVATGRKMQLAYEITGTRGALAFTQERLNELRFYEAGQAPGRGGFKTITTGPEHPDYAAFCQAPGHQLGFNDLKTIEVKDLLQGLAGGPAPWPDFREGWEVQRVIDAIVRSAREDRRVSLSEV